MDAELLGQLDRLEAAIDSVVEGITSYKPEVSAAEALMLADEDLSKALARLEEHQNIFHEVQTLRATADALDARIKSSLAVLVETRSELLDSTPLSLGPNSAKPIAYEEVMNYARRIAKFTVPSIVPKPFPPPRLGSTIPVKYEGSPPLADHSLEGLNGAAASSPFQTLAPQDGRAVVGLNEQQKAWLDSAVDPSNPTFVPWPTEDTIRLGSLAQIQSAKERGLDLTALDLPHVRKAKAMEQEDVVKTEHGAAHESFGNIDSEEKQQQLVASATRQESRPSTQRPRGLEGFNLYDPDSED